MKNIFSFSKNKNYFVMFLFSAIIIILSTQAEDAFAINVDWRFHTNNLNNGGVVDSPIPTDPVPLTVTDDLASGTGSILVKITSSLDPVGFDLTLIEGPLGTFKNSNLALMSDNALTSMSDQLIITVWDDRFPSPEIQTLPDPRIFIFSDSHTTQDFSPAFTETGEETNLFTATINFGPTTDPDTNTLAAKPGDIYTIFDREAGNWNHGFIVPNPNLGKGGIHAEEEGTVTATYKGISDSFTMDRDMGPGRGTGGLIKPGLVLDSSSGPSNDSSGGGCSNCTPPTLGVNSKNDRIVKNGFSFNNNPVNVEYHYTPYPLITVNVGDENIVVLKIFDDAGTQNIEHVGLAYGLGKGKAFGESKAVINLDRTLDGREKISTIDPENVFDNVRIVTSRESCNNFASIQCLTVTIHHTFRDVLEFNMVSTNVWDSKKNAWVNFYNHGIEVTGESLNPPKTKLVAFGEKEKRGLFEFTQIDKKKYLWIDEFGDIYLDKGNDFFVKVFSKQQEKKYDKISNHGCDRNCNWFIENKLNQEMLAEITLSEMLGGVIIKNDFEKQPFSHTYHKLQRSEDPELQKQIMIEQHKAELLFKKLFDER